MFLSDAICLESDHLQADIFWLPVCNSTAVSDFFLTKISIIRQLLLLIAFEFVMLLVEDSFNDCFKFLSADE